MEKPATKSRAAQGRRKPMRHDLYFLEILLDEVRNLEKNKRGLHVLVNVEGT